MKTHQVQQKTERRISAALRLVFVAALLLGQIALAFFLSTELRQRAAIIYTVLELAAFGYAVRIYNRTDGASYKFGWIFLVLTVPVVGLILYFLWNGDRQQKRLDLKKLPMPEEPEAQQAAHRIQMEKLRRKFPQWERLSVYLSRQGYLLYGDTETTYLPTGEAFLQDMLEKLEQAEHFIFMEFFIIAQGQVWDRMEEIFRRKAAEGVEVKIIFDDFGSMMRFPAGQIEALRESGVEVQIFNPVHHYVNRLYFNYRDHRKIVCIDGSTAYTGGANVADEYANLTVRFGYWKDCGIRLDGPGAWGLTREFLHMWQRNGGQLMQERDYYRPHDHREAAGFCQPFVDGPDNSWYADAADFVAQRGLMSGVGENLFGGNQNTTRAMLMTILARMDGQNVTGGATWYEKGMNWAKAKGVSDGTNPNANITREQLVTMMYRYAGSPKADGKLDSFSDAASVSTYAASAMHWAVANGIVNGSNGKLNPQNNATRAQVAAILMRFCEMSK